MSTDPLRHKLALGTVQLGLPYGINNELGQPTQEEAFAILQTATEENILLLDSAEAYGDSLKVIGNYLKEHPNSHFQIISKFIGNEESLLRRLNQNLTGLGVQSLYAYMFHRFSDYRSGRYRKELLSLKQQGKIARIGISVYSIEELEEVLPDADIDLIQIPFNPFDCSPEKMSLLAGARQNRKEIHVRSVFLQGLFFKDPATLTGNLTTLKSSLQKFQHIVKAHGLDIRQACLNFALHQPAIDRVVIGVETLEQLTGNIAAIMPGLPEGFIENVRSIPAVDPFMLNPSSWKLSTTI